MITMEQMREAASNMVIDAHDNQVLIAIHETADKFLSSDERRVWTKKELLDLFAEQLRDLGIE